MKNNKYRFNIVDILLLALIAVCAISIVFLIFYDGKGGNTGGEDNTFEIIYTVEQKQIPDILRGKINMGDNMLTFDGKKNIGHVIDFMYTDSTQKYFDKEMNKTNYAPLEGRIDLTVKVNAVAKKVADGVYEVNGQTISSGQEIEVRFPFYTGSVVCTAVSEMSEVNG